MKMRQRLAAVLAGLVLGGGLAVAVAAPAQASYSECNTGTVCIWNATNGSGSPIGGGFSSTPGTCFDLFGAQNDSADSFRNHTTKSVQFYDNHGCTGQLLKSEDGRTIFDGVTQANFMQVDTVASHPGCQFPSTCNRNRASSVFFNTAFAGPQLLTQTDTSIDAVNWSWCTSTARVCFATDRDGNGTHWVSQLLPVGTCIGVPSNMNDRISSLWNRYTSSGAQLTIYWHNPCGSPQFTYGPNTQVNYVGAINNDEISAVCLGPRRVEGQTTGCP